MERLNNWNYCKDTTLKHFLSVNNKDCLIVIIELSKREGCKKNISFNNNEVLDLDCVETKLSKKEKRSKRNTMDFTFGIKKEKSNSKKMLLIDFKVNAKSGRNIDKQNIIKKVSYSKAILGNEPNINSFNILVYNQKYVKEATSLLRRIFLNKPQFVVISSQELKSSFF